MTPSFLLIAALAFAGQAPPDLPAGASALRAGDYRVASLVYRLASRAAAHCPATHPLTGMLLHHIEEYAEADRPEAARRFGIGQAPGVLAVVAGSPAAEAGLRAGDVLLAVNGEQLRSGYGAGKAAAGNARDAADALIERQAGLGPLQVEVLRNGGRLSLVVKPVAGCAVRGRLARSSQANAFADGRYAVMTTKMLDFVRNDDELAVVMAHEVAHNLLGHPAQLDAQKVPHGILRGVGKNAARVRRTEEEADRLSLKLLRAAGFDLSAAIPFWRRLYARYDPIPIPKLFRTHPSLAARERMILEVTAELEREPVR